VLAHFELLLLIAAGLLIVSVVASRATGKLGIPALLLFLFVGMLAGSDGPGGIYFDNPNIAQYIGVIALSFILFAGGMDTPWQSVRPALREGLTLSTLGVLITAGVMAAFTVYGLGFRWTEGLLFGAIVASTDAAAVFGILRMQDVRLPARLRATLELESGSNDPMAVFLTLVLTQAAMGESLHFPLVMLFFIKQMAIGALAGYLIGRVAVWVMQKLDLEATGLYSVLSVAWVLLSFSLTEVVGGNGFLAVYVAGLMYGSGEFAQRKGLNKFHDGIAWLMQIGLFLVLGLLVFPHKLPAVAWQGLLAAGLLILVARPVSVFISLAYSRTTLSERALISWAGLRGAVPIVLATFPLVAGVPSAHLIFDLVFFVVLVSALIQGALLPAIAGRLGLREGET